MLRALLVVVLLVSVAVAGAGAGVPIEGVSRGGQRLPPGIDRAASRPNKRQPALIAGWRRMAEADYRAKRYAAGDRRI